MSFKNNLANLHAFYKTPIDELKKNLEKHLPNDKFEPKCHIEIIQNGFFQLWDNAIEIMDWHYNDIDPKETKLWASIEHIESYVFESYIDDENWSDEIECQCGILNSCTDLSKCPTVQKVRYQPSRLHNCIQRLHKFLLCSSLVHQTHISYFKYQEVLFVLYVLSAFNRYRIDFIGNGTATEKVTLRKNKKVISSEKVENFGKKSFFTEPDIELLLNKNPRYLESLTNTQVTTKNGIFNLKDYQIKNKDISFLMVTDNEEIKYFLNKGKYRVKNQVNYYEKKHVKTYLENHKDYKPTRFIGETPPYSWSELGYE